MSEYTKEQHDENGYENNSYDRKFDRHFSGFSLHSQYIFIEDKHNGFADFKAPTEWWTKKSAHVIFRRPLTVLNSDESFILKED